MNTSMLRGMPVAERLWCRVDKSGDCWLWTGYVLTNGYAHIKVNGKYDTVHRISWALANGPIPEGLQVLHQCDTPLCVRPAHLFLGTQADNIRDMMQKGRFRLRSITTRHGEKVNTAKLTENDVRTIRATFKEEKRGDLTRMARRYGIRAANLRKALDGRTWQHVV